MSSEIKILIAEDEPNIALALKTIVQKVVPSASINVVSNGREALDTIKVTTYKLIISDWNMPVMTGLDLLTALRKKNASINTPFIMLTARGDKESVISAVKNGVTEYIAKPFDNQQVIDKVQKFLGYVDHEINEEIDDLVDSLINNNFDD